MTSSAENAVVPLATAEALAAIVRRLTEGWSIRPAWGDEQRAWMPPGADDRDWHLVRCDPMTEAEQDALDLALIHWKPPTGTVCDECGAHWVEVFDLTEHKLRWCKGPRIHLWQAAHRAGLTGANAVADS